MSPEDLALVTELLGRPPQGRCEVAVRARDGGPVVIENAPNLDDGTPMPTLYWLVGRSEREAVSRLEAAGGVKEAAHCLDATEVSAAHERYAKERDARCSSAYEHRPSGGVGGTRHGVKCLHAHLAWYLAGGEDPVGAWTAERTGIERADYRSEAAP